MVTREEVAQRAGVSTMTVTRVVTGRGYVSNATRRKVRKVIDQLGYIPNKIASGLVSGKSNRIAIVVPDLTNPYYLQVVGAMIEEAKRDDYVISVYKANEEELPQVLESLISNRVAGVVNYASEFPAKYVRHLEEIGARLIRTSYGEGDFKMELIYERAILQAVESLAANGCRRIIFIAGMGKDYIKIDRRVPYFVRCLEEKGMYLDEHSVINGNYPREEAYIVGYNIAEQLVREGVFFDAAFCMNDMMAFGVINGLKHSGKRVPDDVSVIGFDNIPMSNFFEPPLSTISLDIAREAHFYFNYLAGKESGEENKLVAEYVERQSTRRV